MTTEIPCGAPNCPAMRRIELLCFFAARARLASNELACELCRAKRREYRELTPRRRPPALGPCYIHALERRALYAGVR